MHNAQRTILKIQIQVVLLTVATFVLGVAVGLYLAAAFIGPSILEGAK